MGRKINADEAEALYLAGESSVTLAKRYGCAPGSVLGVLRRRGVPIRPPHRGSRKRIDAATESAMVEAYAGGETQADVAARFGVGFGSVGRALHAAGVPTRPHGLRRATIRVPTDPVAIGYLAGMLDGEGNLQLRQKRENSIGCKLAIYSTTAEVMDWLQAEVGGHVRWDHKRTERHGWLPIGIWEVYRARDVALLLHALLPHLIIKRKAAEEALAMFAAKFAI